VVIKIHAVKLVHNTKSSANSLVARRRAQVSGFLIAVSLQFIVCCLKNASRPANVYLKRANLSCFPVYRHSRQNKARSSEVISEPRACSDSPACVRIHYL
jgi:hypothetical protein